MKIREVYQGFPVEGIEITRRVEMARELFARHLGSAERFLDIGCGAGDVTRYVAQALGAPELDGVEFSEPAAEAAKKNGIRVASVDLNSDRLPYDGATFDAVFCGEVLEHVTDTDHLLLEIRRVMKDTAICVLTTPNLAAWHNRIALALGYQPFLSQVSFRHGPGRPPFVASEGGGHLRVFTYRALVEFVRILGFVVVEARGAGAFQIATPRGAAWARTIFETIDNTIARLRPSLACDVTLVLRRDGGVSRQSSA
ncbi:MAG TPA: class I SAM-dependent methyltransferase [Thermoanaerobaculia bacterium]|jgi:SAM-dependent methyltransferase|nr:class I SAM-dependent methyltransferase [Thermoanaerobaculia bacterium]